MCSPFTSVNSLALGLEGIILGGQGTVRPREQVGSKSLLERVALGKPMKRIQSLARGVPSYQSGFFSGNAMSCFLTR